MNNTPLQEQLDILQNVMRRIADSCKQISKTLAEIEFDLSKVLERGDATESIQGIDWVKQSIDEVSAFIKRIDHSYYQYDPTKLDMDIESIKLEWLKNAIRGETMALEERREKSEDIVFTKFDNL